MAATIPNYTRAETVFEHEGKYYGYNAPPILNGTSVGWTRMGDEILLSMSTRASDSHVKSQDVSDHPHVVQLAKRARRRRRMRRKKRRGY
jgi:hypothetical protein